MQPEVQKHIAETLAQFAHVDLASSAGVAAIVLILIQILKSQVLKPIWPSYGLIVNVLTVIVGIGVGFVGLLLVPDLTWKQALYNGIIGGLGTVFGYEAVKNLIKSIRATQ